MNAERAVKKIIADLRDRIGLGHAWRKIEEEVQDEIRAEWEAIIAAESRLH